MFVDINYRSNLCRGSPHEDEKEEIKLLTLSDGSESEFFTDHDLLCLLVTRSNLISNQDSVSDTRRIALLNLKTDN